MCFLKFITLGKRNKNDRDKVVVAEYKISMQCDDCENLVARTILKIKGVENFTTDVVNHEVMIIGKIDPAKVLKKLQKTGKTVEMILAYEFENNSDDEEQELEAFQQPDVDPLISDTLGDTPMYTIFSDENPNACSIM